MKRYIFPRDDAVVHVEQLPWHRTITNNHLPLRLLTLCKTWEHHFRIDPPPNMTQLRTKFGELGMLGNVHVVDVLHSNPADYKFLTWGSKSQIFAGESCYGLTIGDCPKPDYTEWAGDDYAAAAVVRRPIIQHISTQTGTELSVRFRALLPILRPDGVCTTILSAWEKEQPRIQLLVREGTLLRPIERSVRIGTPRRQTLKWHGE